MPKPPIRPESAEIVPDILTADAVICPDDFKCRFPADADMVSDPSMNPPIKPSSAVTVPDMLIADAVI